MTGTELEKILGSEEYEGVMHCCGQRGCGDDFDSWDKLAAELTATISAAAVAEERERIAKALEARAASQRTFFGDPRNVASELLRQLFEQGVDVTESIANEIREGLL